MAKGQESIGFETLKSLLANTQQKPLEQHRTERIDGVTWWVLDLMIPEARSPIPGFVPDVPVHQLASVSYRPKGVVDAKEVIGFRDRTKGVMVAWSGVLAASDGFTEEAMKVFRRSKRIDYISETHWPKDWPRGPAASSDS
jgi:hypothetical protein